MDTRDVQFEALVNAHSADLFRFAVWLCRDRALAEDLVQETFLRAWRGLKGLRSDGSARAWLITILRREFLRHREQRPPPSSDVPLEAIVDRGQSDHEETAVLQSVLSELSEEYREPLLLQVLGGFTAEEIGAMLDIAPGAVLTRLFRARQKLRKALESPGAARSAWRLEEKL